MIAAALSFSLLVALYWSHPSTLWNFDGVACAAALEYSDPTYFFHSQHLIYGFLGWLFWKAIAFFHDGVRALAALQILTPIFSAIGMVVFWHTLTSILKNARLAAILVGFLSVSAVFWVWSIEPQVYSLGFLGLALATQAMLSGDKNAALKTGFWHGLAVLGHAMHIIWIIPAVFYFVRESRDRNTPLRPILLRYIGILSLVMSLAYAAVLLFVLIPSGKGWSWISIWLKGSMGLTPDRSFAWHWMGWSGPLLWLKSTLSVGWGTFWPYATSVGIVAWTLTGLSMILAALCLFRAFLHRQENLVQMSILWITVYGILLSTWEPETLCYRMTDVLPLGLLFSTGLRGLNRTKMAYGFAILAMVVTAAVNFGTRIRPMQNSDNNAAYVNVMRFHRDTPSEVPFHTKNSLERLYALYFAGRMAYLQP